MTSSDALPPAMARKMRNAHFFFAFIGLVALAYGALSTPTDRLSLAVGTVVTLIYALRGRELLRARRLQDAK